MKWIFSGAVGLIIVLALWTWQPKRHDTTLVVPEIRPCIDKRGKEVPNGTIEDGMICTDTLVWHEEPQASAHGKVREEGLLK